MATATAKTYTKDLTVSPVAKTFEVTLILKHKPGETYYKDAKALGTGLSDQYFWGDWGKELLKITVKEIEDDPTK